MLCPQMSIRNAGSKQCSQSCPYVQAATRIRNGCRHCLQVPSTWRPVLEDPATLQLFLDFLRHNQAATVQHGAGVLGAHSLEAAAADQAWAESCQLDAAVTDAFLENQRAYNGLQTLGMCVCCSIRNCALSAQSSRATHSHVACMLHVNKGCGGFSV